METRTHICCKKATLYRKEINIQQITISEWDRNAQFSVDEMQTDGISEDWIANWLSVSVAFINFVTKLEQFYSY